MARVNLPQAPRIWGEQGQARKDGVLEGHAADEGCPPELGPRCGGVVVEVGRKTRRDRGEGGEARTHDWARRRSSQRLVGQPVQVQ